MLEIDSSPLILTITNKNYPRSNQKLGLSKVFRKKKIRKKKIHAGLAIVYVAINFLPCMYPPVPALPFYSPLYQPYQPISQLCF